MNCKESAKPIMLWSVPRSASTAFERIFIERGDMKIFHEPYSCAYYFSKQRKSNRYSDTPPKKESSYDEITGEILSSHERASVFIKDMAFHVNGYWTHDFLNKLRNTFLIREPISALNSQYKLLPDFTLAESGYPSLKEIFFAVADQCGEAPLLIDTQDFTSSHQNVLEKYCSYLDIPFISSSLNWEKREVPEWDVWKGWHTGALDSTGIRPITKKSNEIAISDHVKSIADEVMPIYEEMIKYKYCP